MTKSTPKGQEGKKCHKMTKKKAPKKIIITPLNEEICFVESNTIKSRIRQTFLIRDLPALILDITLKNL